MARATCQCLVTRRQVIGIAAKSPSLGQFATTSRLVFAGHSESAASARVPPSATAPGPGAFAIQVCAAGLCRVRGGLIKQQQQITESFQLSCPGPRWQAARQGGAIGRSSTVATVTLGGKVLVYYRDWIQLISGQPRLASGTRPGGPGLGET
jgi:hypothetical protein